MRTFLDYGPLALLPREDETCRKSLSSTSLAKDNT